MAAGVLCRETSLEGNPAVGGVSRGPRRSGAAIARRLAAPLAAAAVIFLVSWPLTWGRYGLSDDYFFWYAARVAPQEAVANLFACGRFVGAGLLMLAFSGVEKATDLGWVRAGGALSLAVFSALLTATLARRGWPSGRALAVALLICSTPAACLMVTWAQNVAFPVALILTLCAYALQAQIHRPFGPKTIVMAACAVLTLWCALAVHQSYGTFYIALIALDLFAVEGTADWRKLARDTTRAAAIGGLAFLMAFASIMAQSHPNTRAVLTHDPAAKLLWFVREPLCNAASLFTVGPRAWVYWPILALIAIGLVSYLVRGRRRAALALALMLVLIPISYLPNLVTAENWAAYRSLFSPAALVVLALAFALRGIFVSRPALTGVVLWALVGTGLAFYSYQGRRYMQEAHTRELELLMGELQALDPSRVTEIHIVRPGYGDGAPRVAYDEFGLPTTYHPWAARYIVWAGARELGDAAHRELAERPVRSVAQPDPERREGIAVIDMHRLADWRTSGGHAGPRP